MARRRRRKNSGSLLLLGLVALVILIPKEAWIGIGIATAVGFALYFGHKWQPTVSKDSVGDKVVARYEDEGEFIAPADARPRAAHSEFAVPKPPEGFGVAKWIPSGHAIRVANFIIPGGLIYVGTTLPAANGQPDPSLINPALRVSAQDASAAREMGYWPSYSEISPAARRAYLKWLAGGRQDPNVYIGYVFLFFYGLERRAILDAPRNPEAAAELPIIAEEVRRLLTIYGDQSGSFRRYAGELLDWVSLASYPPQLYKQPVPSFPKTFELPLYIRLALGQTAIDGVPVPAHIALAWARLEPTIGLRTPAIRCAREFDDLFVYKYKEAHGDGILLPKNRTKLKFVYRPASGGFLGRSEIKISFGDVPDITVLTGPIESLRSLVESTTSELEAYSRFVGRNPDASSSLEALILLPVRMWPDTVRRNLAMLKVQLARSPRVLLLGDLLSLLGAQDALTREKMKSLVRALDAIKVGFEPDILAGARVPKVSDKIVVFATEPEDATAREAPAYRAAALTLELSSAIAAADGDISAEELDHLREEVQRWDHLSVNHRYRLTARLSLLQEAPVSLSAIRKKLEGLASAQKETIAAFMATIAQADGVVSPDEVKILERAYKALGVEPKKVFSNLHAVAAGAHPEKASTRETTRSGFRLDPARIAALQKETQQVSALLANIFAEEDTTPAPPPAEPEPEASEPMQPQELLGLDAAHSAFARLLLSRPLWTREEMSDAALDLELMLDGALERINEAAFDTYDIPFTEGDDPVEVNAELLGRLEA